MIECLEQLRHEIIRRSTEDFDKPAFLPIGEWEKAMHWISKWSWEAYGMPPVIADIDCSNFLFMGIPIMPDLPECHAIFEGN